VARTLQVIVVLAVVSCSGSSSMDETGSTSTTDTSVGSETGGESSTTATGESGTSTETGTETGSEAGSCPEGELGDDDNCGACGVACTIYDLYAFGEYGGCEDGACKPTWSPCFDEADGYADCAAACAAFGEECVAQGCGDGVGYTATAYVTPEACEEFESPQDAWYGSIACDDAPTLGGGAGRCCCTDTP
jgi:hypothetical protein